MSSMLLHSFQDDLVFEFLSMLPVNTLLQYRIVCKKWKNLIDSRYFIQKYLSHVQNFDPSCPKIVAYPLYSKVSKLFLIDLNKINGIVPSHMERRLPFPETLIKKGYKRILGTSNGLICLLDQNPLKIILWNPLLRKFIVYAPPHPQKGFVEYLRSSYGFVYDKVRDDYKIIWMEKGTCQGEFCALVYSLKSKTWRELIDNISYGTSLVSIYQDDGVSVDGVVYWITNTSNKDTIIGLDITTEKFHVVTLPIEYHPPFTVKNLGILNDRLCLSCRGYDGFDIWLMNRHGSWTKFMNLACCEDLDHRSVPITIMHDENEGDKEFVAMFGGFNDIMCLDVETESVIKKIGHGGNTFAKVLPYVETLELHSQEKWAQQGLEILSI